MTEGLAYGLAYVAAAAISLSVGIAAWRRRPAPGALGLAVLSFAQAEWSGAFAAQWMFTDRGPSLAWLAIRNVGLFITPIAILVLVNSYIGRERWLTRRKIAALSAVPALGWLMTVTDPWHGLYLAGVEPSMKFTHGGPVLFVTLAYSYGLILYALGLLVAHTLKRPPYVEQSAALLVALLLPVVHFAAQLAGLDLLPRVNSVPFTFTISGALTWLALTRLGLFRLVPVARDQLLEQLPVGVVVFDAQRRIIDINPAAVRMTGAVGPITGKTADEAFPRQMETILRLREELLDKDSATAQAEFAPGLWIEATASVLHDRAGQRIATLVTLRDISERRAAERMQREFVANVAHELQTPLTGLSLLARTIPRAMEDDPQAAKRFLERLEAEVARLTHLTNELMTLSQAETDVEDRSTELVDVAEVIREQVEHLEPLSEAKSQTVHVDVPCGIIASCNARDLGAIVGNLLRNAIRYTGSGGNIFVRAEQEHDAGAPWVLVRVTDDGIGIPKEDQERVFDRFYRVDKARSRRTGGAGLGLSIVKQLAEKHGGCVALESEPGQGTTVTVRLPMA